MKFCSTMMVFHSKEVKCMFLGNYSKQSNLRFILSFKVPKNQEKTKNKFFTLIDVPT